MSFHPEEDIFDHNFDQDKRDYKQSPIDLSYEPSTYEETEGNIGIDSLIAEEVYHAYHNNNPEVFDNFPYSLSRELCIESKNVIVSTSFEIKEDSREESGDSGDSIPRLDKHSKKISKSKFEKSKKSDSKKDDPKKNAPGLHRDRALKCSKDLLKVLKKEVSLAALERAYDSFELSTKRRFGFMMVILRANAEHFSEYAKFIDYMKKKFQPDWKDNKTWSKLNEFCEIREYLNAGKIFKQIMYAIIDRKDNSEIDIWMTKFRGNENTKEYLISPQYKKDFELHVHRQ